MPVAGCSNTEIVLGQPLLGKVQAHETGTKKNDQSSIIHKVLGILCFLMNIKELFETTQYNHYQTYPAH